MLAIRPATYYVYTYAYPDGTVFYVGKGCKSRLNAHEVEAESGCECKKCSTIRSIWASGHPVQKRIVFETLDEQEALRNEYRLIASFPSEQLTNVALVAVLTATNLKALRESLGATQEQVAHRTQSVNLRTYIRAEQGKTSVRYDTAMQILEAVNGLLADAGRSPVTLEDLGLKIF